MTNTFNVQDGWTFSLQGAFPHLWSSVLNLRWNSHRDGVGYIEGKYISEVFIKFKTNWSFTEKRSITYVLMYLHRPTDDCYEKLPRFLRWDIVSSNSKVYNLNKVPWMYFIVLWRYYASFFKDWTVGKVLVRGFFGWSLITLII